MILCHTPNAPWRNKWACNGPGGGDARRPRTRALMGLALGGGGARAHATAAAAVIIVVAAVIIVVAANINYYLVNLVRS